MNSKKEDDVDSVLIWGTLLLMVVCLSLFIFGQAKKVEIRPAKVKPFVCSHSPHLGSCKATEAVYNYNVTLKMVTPVFRDCGCVSDHGVTISR